MKYRNMHVLHCLQDPISTLKPAIAIARDMRLQLEIWVINQVTHPADSRSIVGITSETSKNLSESMYRAEMRVREIVNWLDEIAFDARVTTCTQQIGLVDHEISIPTLYADLVLYHRWEQSLVSGQIKKELESVIFDAGKPVLILAKQSAVIGCDFKSVAIAWDPVPEAMKAITASLPLLKRAVKVSVVVVNDYSDFVDSHLKRFFEWLESHKIHAVYDHVPQGDLPVSEVLINHINASDCDLVIMGLYGQSRLSEPLLSGVSHTVLEKSNKSLFVAH